jgi:hypothetical protein
MLPDVTQIADPFHVVKLANFVPYAGRPKWSLLGLNSHRDSKHPIWTQTDSSTETSTGGLKSVKAAGTVWHPAPRKSCSSDMSNFREKGSPQILLYRKAGAPMVDLADRESVLDHLDQLDRLDQYIDHWFRHPDRSFLGAFHTFTDPDAFESMLLVHLCKLIDNWLAEQSS